MKTIKLEIVKAHKLDPNKKYLIEIPSTSYTMENAYDLGQVLKEKNIDGVIAVRRGDELITISELPFTPEVNKQKLAKKEQK